MKEQGNFRKWLSLVVLFVGGGIIFQLPYLRLAFNDIAVKAMGLTNTEFGFLGTVYGMTAAICYFPGGWLADKFSCRKQIAFSFVATGLSGFYFATFPSYAMNIVLNIFWGVTTILTYWASLIKAVRMLGNNDEQPKLYGILEGGRGFTSAVAAFIVLYLFNMVGGGQAGFTWLILFYSGVSIVIGIVSYLVLEDSTGKNLGSTTITMQELVEVMKNKNSWLIAAVIFTTYSIFAGQTYFSGLLTGVYMVPASLVAILSIVRTYVMQLAGGVTGGVVAGKLGSSSKMLKIGYFIILAGVLLFWLMPAGPTLMMVAIINMIAIGLTCYAMRGVYYSTISEVEFPAKVSGSVAGFVSFIGFIPDIFIYVMIGNWIDQNPGKAGYDNVFYYMIAMMVIGIAAISQLQKSAKAVKDAKLANFSCNETAKMSTTAN